jgi:hypothetical protein
LSNPAVKVVTTTGRVLTAPLKLAGRVVTGAARRLTGKS